MTSWKPLVFALPRPTRILQNNTLEGLLGKGAYLPDAAVDVDVEDEDDAFVVLEEGDLEPQAKKALGRS